MSDNSAKSEMDELIKEYLADEIKSSEPVKKSFSLKESKEQNETNQNQTNQNQTNQNQTNQNQTNQNQTNQNQTNQNDN